MNKDKEINTEYIVLSSIGWGVDADLFKAVKKHKQATGQRSINCENTAIYRIDYEGDVTPDITMYMTGHIEPSTNNRVSYTATLLTNTAGPIKGGIRHEAVN